VIQEKNIKRRRDIDEFVSDLRKDAYGEDDHSGM
jgi:hypothetical protein